MHSLEIYINTRDLPGNAPSLFIKVVGFDQLFRNPPNVQVDESELHKVRRVQNITQMN